jgi:hypothetical protein
VNVDDDDEDEPRSEKVQIKKEVPISNKRRLSEESSKFLGEGRKMQLSDRQLSTHFTTSPHKLSSSSSNQKQTSIELIDLMEENGVMNIDDDTEDEASQQDD